MTTISLRIPKSLHSTVKELVKQEVISMNQFITMALVEKVSAIATEEYLEKRAERASRLGQLLYRPGDAPGERNRDGRQDQQHEADEAQAPQV